MCTCCSVRVMFFFFFKQKTAYEMRISDWSSDVCSSDLAVSGRLRPDEFRTQAFIDRSAVAGLWLSALRVVEGVVGRSLDLRAVAHQIGHDHPTAVLLVVEPERGAAGGAVAQLQGAVWGRLVEGAALPAVWCVTLTGA